MTLWLTFYFRPERRRSALISNGFSSIDFTKNHWALTTGKSFVSSTLQFDAISYVTRLFLLREQLQNRMHCVEVFEGNCVTRGWNVKYLLVRYFILFFWDKSTFARIPARFVLKSTGLDSIESNSVYWDIEIRLEVSLCSFSRALSVLAGVFRLCSTSNRILF